MGYFEYIYKLLNDRYGEFYEINAGLTFTITTANIPHALIDLTTGACKSVTYTKGQGTAAITVFADGGSGQVVVTSANHGMSDGVPVTIAGTTNYNGVFLITNTATNTFEITDTWVANDAAGNWRNPTTLSPDNSGTYIVNYSISAKTAGANKEFEYRIYKNAAVEPVGAAHRMYANTNLGNAGSSAICSCSAGDLIWFAADPKTDTTNLTLNDVNFNIHHL